MQYFGIIKCLHVSPVYCEAADCQYAPLSSIDDEIHLVSGRVAALSEGLLSVRRHKKEFRDGFWQWRLQHPSRGDRVTDNPIPHKVYHMANERGNAAHLLFNWK